MQDGGILNVSGTASDITLLDGARTTAYIGSTLSSIMVTSGGTVTAEGGATLKAITLGDGGTLNLSKDVAIADRIMYKNGSFISFPGVGNDPTAVSANLFPDTSYTNQWQVLVYSGGTQIDQVKVSAAEVINGSVGWTSSYAGTLTVGFGVTRDILVTAGAVTRNAYISGFNQYVSGTAIDTNLQAVSGSNAQKAQIIYSGGVASGASIGALQIVENGGKAFDTRLTGGNSFVASQTVENGGYISGSTIYASAVSVIEAGASATETTLNSGMQIVSGFSDKVAVSGGGQLSVIGSAANISVASGGLITVSNGSTISSLTLASGASLALGSAVKIADPITVNSASVITFIDTDDSQNTISASLVSSDPTAQTGVIEVLSSGNIIQTLEVKGGFSPNIYWGKDSANHMALSFYNSAANTSAIVTSDTVIAPGHTLQNVFVSGATLYVAGSAYNTNVRGKATSQNSTNGQYSPNQSGTLIVMSGGVASKNAVSATFQYSPLALNGEGAAATQIIRDGGKAYDTTLEGAAHSQTPGVGGQYFIEKIAASQTVEAGGYVSGVQVNGLGVSIIQAGASATNTVLSGFVSSLYSATGNYTYGSNYGYVPVTLSGAQIVSGVSENIQIEQNGYLTVVGSAKNVFIMDGGTATALSGAKLSDVTIGSGGILEIHSGVMLDGAVNINSGSVMTFLDTDDTQGMLSAALITSDDGKTEIKVLSAGNVVQTLPVQGDTSAPLQWTNNASNHLELGFGTPCYCPGTLIATPDGERAVENLKIGDTILTAFRAQKTIRWIGRRTYNPLFVQGNRDILPVLIKKGALGNDLPKRDLKISPLHAMFINGFLVPALYLVNDISIIQIQNPEDISYIHIELEDHDILLAEGAPSESFVDDNSRAMFHNSFEYDRLYPGAKKVPAQYCAPRLEEGPELVKIQDYLLDVAHKTQGCIKIA
ncbi:Hint domain-containing protein [Acetobacter cibinongensis]|uniref:Hint domain-containing protein n=1 Tax=Acetobacter cibinongensis TaxID=146475 RepID=UPI001F0B6AFC|nr:Hint domain-containing protein [Acetobacter cibinongensis]